MVIPTASTNQQRIRNKKLWLSINMRDKDWGTLSVSMSKASAEKLEDCRFFFGYDSSSIIFSQLKPAESLSTSKLSTPKYLKNSRSTSSNLDRSNFLASLIARLQK
ncbi:hypothetical protein Fot_37480 [Forsythia ovata]|uniref:Uncharacterized protein n=1 Tax=Forsythia ovata TaxID=205694 RepID=A0ABD1RZN8_9LAMI